MPEAKQRVDKWLWHARMVKSRTLAAALVSDGLVRINRQKVVKSSHEVGPGDVLTLTLHGRIVVLRVVACAGHRGPAPVARLLYETIDSSDG